MTLPYETLAAAFASARAFVDENRTDCAALRGIQMEGPFFSEKKKGAQNGAYLRLPDFDAFRKLFEDCGGLVRIVDVAPELEGACDFIRKASKLCTVSIAHTDADYDAAAAGIAAGVTHLTHLYNAMPAIHHRKPGVIAAAAEAEAVSAELDLRRAACPSGIRAAGVSHLRRGAHGADLRLAALLRNARRRIRAGRSAGLLKDGIARLADGTIAGSATNLYDCMLRAISFRHSARGRRARRDL